MGNEYQPVTRSHRLRRRSGERPNNDDRASAYDCSRHYNPGELQVLQMFPGLFPKRNAEDAWRISPKCDAPARNTRSQHAIKSEIPANRHDALQSRLIARVLQALGNVLPAVRG